MPIKINEIYGIIPKERVLYGSAVEDKYQSDVMGRTKGNAEAVVFPVSTEEISALMRYAYENNVPVTPRGAGTNLVGSTVPLKGGIVLDVSLMNRVLELDSDSLTAVVEPGILLEDFQNYVEERGLFYPPDPGERRSSIGGNISTNAGGMRAVKYGVTRDYVRGLELVLANGDIITVGSKNVKDSSGLSLKSLIIGAEGTLAVITKCILRLVPKPEASQTILIPYLTRKQGLDAVIKLLHTVINPTAVEFVERTVVELGENYTGVKVPHPEAQAYLLLIIDGGKPETEYKTEQLKKLSKETNALDFLPLYGKAADDIWRMRGAFQKAVEAFSEQEPVDVVVPVNKTGEFIQFVHEYEEKSGVKIYSFGHAGDGNVHLSMLRESRNQSEWDEERCKALTEIFEKAKSLGGLPSGEHGIGVSKQKYYLRITDEINIRVMNSVKNAFDERGILNPGKTYHKI